MKRQIQIERDYRNWLLKELKKRKDRNPLYSARAFSRDLNISTTTMYRVFSGERHLSTDGVALLAEKFELTPVEIKSIHNQLKQSKNEQKFFKIALKSAENLVAEVVNMSLTAAYDLPTVRRLLANANDIYSDLLVSGGDSVDLKVAVAMYRSALAHLKYSQHNYQIAAQLAEHAIADLEVILEQIPNNIDILAALTDAYSTAAYSYRAFGTSHQELQAHQKAKFMTQRLANLKKSTTTVRDLSIAYFNVGSTQLRLGKCWDALSSYNQALQLAETARADSTESHLALSYQAFANVGLARSYDFLGCYQDASGYAALAIGHFDEELKHLPSCSNSQSALADILTIHAGCCIALGKDDLAERSLLRAEMLLSGLKGMGSQHVEAYYYEERGHLYLLQNEPDKAYQCFIKAAAIMFDLNPQAQPNDYTSAYVRIQLKVIEILQQRNQVAEAMQKCRELTSLVDKAAGDSALWELHYLVARSHAQLIALLPSQENINPSELTGSFQKALAGYLQLLKKYPYNEKFSNEIYRWLNDPSVISLAKSLGKETSDYQPLVAAPKKPDLVAAIQCLLQTPKGPSKYSSWNEL